MRIFFLTGMLACFSFLLSVAQPELKTAVDKNEILIGDQFTLKIEADFSPEDYKITWPVVPDSLSHFEVVNRGKIDSLYNDSRITGLAQTITLTSFDSGQWVLPSFLVSLVPVRDDTMYNLFTDSMPITVSFSTADTTHQLRDIKPIREVETINPLWYWIGAGVLLILLIVFITWFYKYWRKNKTSVPLRVRTSSYDEAMKELEKLKGYDLSLPADIKIVHTKLAEILKRFLSHRQGNNYLNKTTGDVLILLRDHFPDKNMLAKAAASLRCGDAVKFAKYLPPVGESEECLLSVKEIINGIQQTQAHVASSVTVNPKK